MTLLKFEPLRNFDLLGEKVHRYFGEFPSSFDANNSFFPKIEISEDEKNIYLEAEIPGMKKEEINITLEDNILTVKGEKKFNEEKKQRSLIRNERVYGSFTRSFTLHEEANPDSTSAEFENGVLKIAIGKVSHKTVKERQINVK